MKSANASIIAGVVIIVLGVLLLLDRVGIMDTASFVAPLIFAAVGVVFLALFIRRRANWWAAIPGSVFLGLAAVITTAQLTGGAWGAAFLFVFMGAGFAAVFLREPGNWWALIPPASCSPWRSSWPSRRNCRVPLPPPSSSWVWRPPLVCFRWFRCASMKPATTGNG
ncbi:hypothetical protein [Paenarthrobacter ureafaciens]|uniref:hypothetical protein n=1 Tax=Paenarthrobacter ureafaciens TaxID=37931 RepID=UPI001D17BBC7|nr:hypothetical protein [Paenarthrobacter ureafaciens]